MSRAYLPNSSTVLIKSNAHVIHDFLWAPATVRPTSEVVNYKNDPLAQVGHRKFTFDQDCI